MEERANRLMMLAAAVTALVLLAQVALINAMSGAYLDGHERVALDKEELDGGARGKAAVFEQLQTLPVVLMHGMGDAAGNSGMRRIQKVRARRGGETGLIRIRADANHPRRRSRTSSACMSLASRLAARCRKTSRTATSSLWTSRSPFSQAKCRRCASNAESEAVSPANAESRSWLFAGPAACRWIQCGRLLSGWLVMLSPDDVSL